MDEQLHSVRLNNQESEDRRQLEVNVTLNGTGVDVLLGDDLLFFVELYKGELRLVVFAEPVETGGEEPTHIIPLGRRLPPSDKKLLSKDSDNQA